MRQNTNKPKNSPETAVSVERDVLTSNHFPDTFTGEVHTFVYKPHNGFANFAIATLQIKDGRIAKITLSDPYAGFEAVARIDMLNAKAMEAMRNVYPAGYQRHV